MKTLILCAMLAAAGIAAPAQARVYIGLDVPLVVVAPPEAPPEVVEVAPPPRPGYYWNRGYQRWNGESYVWVRGSWGSAGRAGQVWMRPGWQHEGNGWRWHQGRWH